MTTTPLPPLDWVEMLKEAIGIVKGKPTYKRFIDGTPLSNDVPVWMADFAIQHATQARADLEAENAHLKAVLKDVSLFLHHCWCDVQMNEHSFDLLNKQTEAVDAALETKT